MSIGKSVRLYLVDGRPGGLLTAEIMNWTGHVMAAPRSEAQEKLLKRPEARRTGVYILLGSDPEPQAYIGETDELAKRLNENRHDRLREDWWDRVVLVTSKDENVTKAHVRYVESQLISKALAAKRSKVINKTNPDFDRLPEADKSDMDYFIAQLDIVLPVVGVDVFRVPQTHGATQATSSADARVLTSPEFRLEHRATGAVARAQQVDGEFVVIAGSSAAPAISLPPNAVLATQRQFDQRVALRAALVASGALVDDGNRARFAHDTVFKSPSAAGCIVKGAVTCNGRVDWKTPDGVPFGEWESGGLESPGTKTSQLGA
ncbi:MAG TPA: GIY-YIG nuclease family protein [Pseudolysinimonas sp.]|jgi:hypothetical protein|nr:GIY-YIG nuclease family protein [Pseudolysinimonas sp.]